MTEAFTDLMVKELDERKNPSDLKPSIIGTVVKLEPLIVSIDQGKTLLEENDDLLISEWFRFRCNIDETQALSLDVITNVNSATAVEEFHSYPPTPPQSSPCIMPSAIGFLANAIQKINTELLQLKCELEVGDLVCVTSLDAKNRYLLIDKVL